MCSLEIWAQLGMYVVDGHVQGERIENIIIRHPFFSHFFVIPLAFFHYWLIFKSLWAFELFLKTLCVWKLRANNLCFFNVWSSISYNDLWKQMWIPVDNNSDYRRVCTLNNTFAWEFCFLTKVRTALNSSGILSSMAWKNPRDQTSIRRAFLWVDLLKCFFSWGSG